MQNTTQTEMDLNLTDLNQYYGSENYYKEKMFSFCNYTDGIRYIMLNGYSWLVTDFLSLIATNKNGLKEQEFLSIQLKLNGSKAKMLVTDGNENTLYKQEYEYTNCKKEVTLFYTNNVLLLSGEY